MLKIGVLVSGGGTNLQAIIDNINTGNITNSKMGNCSCSLVVYDFGQDLLAGPRKRVDGVWY